jgi:hypothetical protein
MADTIRTLTALLALLADNTTGDISPQDVRDMLVTVHGVYGGIYIQDGSTPQTGIDTTPTKMTGWATNTASAGTTPDQANNQITVGTDGVYLIWASVGFSGSVNTTFQGHLRVNDIESWAGFHRKLSAGGDVGSVSFVSLLVLSADDVLSIYIESDAGGGASMTPTDAQLIVYRVA